MRATKITDNLIQLTRMGWVNAYLVREDDGFTLVDTTIAKGADDLLAAAREHGAEIRRIALTHGHGDHVGSVDELERKIDVPVLLSELDARIHAGEKPYEGKLRGGWPKLETVPERINPGDRVGSLEVVASPGHTPGHVAFLDTRDRALIAGDAFTTIGGLQVPDHFHLRFPLAYTATWNRPLARESAAELLALQPSVLVVGHGKAVFAPIPALR
jgi:glyoxylase-like metal-dependent hydrolase (beta-lactamase superfamily II)